jgi:hypothetical protein
MEETKTEAEAMTPGRVIHESLRESAVAEFGLPAERFEAWDDLLPAQRRRLEAAGEAVIAASPDVAKRLADGNRKLRAENNELRQRLADEDIPGYWEARTALGTDDGLAARARQAPAMVDATLAGHTEPHGPDHRCFDCATDDELAASIPPSPAPGAATARLAEKATHRDAGQYPAGDGRTYS